MLVEVPHSMTRESLAGEHCELYGWERPRLGLSMGADHPEAGREETGHD
jgi:hypothetical protein